MNLIDKELQTKAGSKGVVKQEPTRMVLPPDVLRKNAEEFAEKIRDGVNSALGRDRLSISTMYDFTDDSVGLLFEDADTQHDRLYIGWEMGCDVDGTIDMILDGKENNGERDEV